MQIDELVLVYAADSGLLSAIADSAAKLFSLKGCTLCAITHGLAGERAEWSECRQQFGVPVTYFHRDDLPSELRAQVGEALPCVLARVGSLHHLLLDPEALQRCNGKVADLRGRLKHRARLLDLTFPAEF